ncbi:MAG: hypothetical protein IKY74_00400 [Alistipes sp.]|nr:hypothetical protein [Alistipes sp.]
MLLFARQITVDGRRQICKEIMPQNNRNSIKQLRVETRFSKDAVDVGSITRQMIGKPYHRALLARQLSSDKFSYSWGIHTQKML